MVEHYRGKIPVVLFFKSKLKMDLQVCLKMMLFYALINI